MLFAAGFGTRMRPLTQTRPKPLIKVAGRTLIDRTLDMAQAIAPAPIVANLHYLPDHLLTHLAGTDVHCVVEAPEILETGGGFKNALPHLGAGPVVTSNTDAIWLGPNPFELITKAWNPQIMDSLLMCVPKAAVHGHTGQGDFDLDENGHIKRGRDVVYGGIQIVKPDVVANVEDSAFSFNLVWDKLIARDRLFGLTYPGEWCDIGTPTGIDLAETLLAQHADG